MQSEIAQLITDNIDEITRGWVDDLRHTSRTDVHKQLLSAEIIGGIKGMLTNLAAAIDSAELPDGETMPVPLFAPVSQAEESSTPDQVPPLRQRTTKPLQGPLAQARTAAIMVGRLRHKQNYEIQEVIYEYVKLREHIWQALRSYTKGESGQQSATETFAYIDRLLDELMLTTVENFYNTSIHDLEKRAIHDPMTQLYNKDYFYQRLNEEMRRSIRYAEPIVVAFIDMDRLKSINDTYGHQAGDEVIKAVAAAIKSRCRQTDIPCRYGGDEFAVILPETTKAQARIYAERVVQTVQSLSVILVSGSTSTGPLPGTGDNGTESVIEDKTQVQPEKTSLFAPVPTISVGLAAFPEDARNPETLLAKADEALYRSKSGGRNMISE